MPATGSGLIRSMAILVALLGMAGSLSSFIVAVMNGFKISFVLFAVPVVSFLGILVAVVPIRNSPSPLGPWLERLFEERRCALAGVVAVLRPSLKGSAGSREIPRPSNSQPKKSVAIVSYLDYPYPAGLSRRIEGFVAGLQDENFPTQVISPIFRSSHKPSDCGLLKADLSFLKVLGAESLAIKIVALALFNFFAFVRILASRKKLLAVQYESVYSFPAALLAKIFCGCTSIGDDVLILAKSTRAAALIRALACTTDLMVCSTNDMVSKWAGRTRVLYVPNGISTRFVVRRHSINLERLKVVFVGALSYHTNIRAVEHILEASSSLREECEFLVVGGPIPEKFTKGGVSFLGQLDDDALSRLYAGANVGVLPFFGTAAEGPKVKVLEYMAAQLLVVSSPEGIAGYPDLVAWEHYVPAASVEEFVRILRDAPRNANQYARIVMRGHEFAINHYRWSYLLEDYLEFMDRLRCSEEERCLESTKHESGGYPEVKPRSQLESSCLTCEC